MLCSEVQLVKATAEGEEIKPLPCNRWSCDYCAPRRRRALVAIAASGHPNKILTITVNPAIGDSPTDRRNLLHDAWKRLVKRILRQFALPPERRWQLKTAARLVKMQHMIAGIDSKTPQGAMRQIHYMAFLERTRLGEPHLHVLLRCPFIPQDWIAEQMGEMTGAPVCWIEAIKNTRAAVFYVTKYVAKEPAQFGATKRYWISRGWQMNSTDAPEREKRDMTGVRVRRERWLDTIAAHDPRGYVWDFLEDGWVRFVAADRGSRVRRAGDVTTGRYRVLERVPF